MHFNFSDVSQPTLQHWREFALQHLYDSDRLTRNLYDLRQVNTIPEEAVRFALEANTDPAARNIRVAVVVTNEEVKEAVMKIAALAGGFSAHLAVFTDIDQAEDWLNQPLEKML
jgi:hypothetical protein